MKTAGRTKTRKFLSLEKRKGKRGKGESLWTNFISPTTRRKL
jgi:hypothetical protein